jgi:cellulose synthase/poly-beta-1,6-N-acetylglucosamine synthase-like glycosyltransferase
VPPQHSVGMDPARRAPLAQHVRLLRRAAGSRLVVALIPAHNESGQIENAIRSLADQETPPDLIVVCADNCTDDTAAKAEQAGAVVFETGGNEHKKAGALNQVLERVLPKLWVDDAILVMDADSVPAPTFIAEAAERLGDGVGGVGGVFTGRSGDGFVGRLRRNARPTAALLSARTLRHVVWARQKGVLPGGAPQVYDQRVDTADGQLTLALLLLGYKVVSPKERRLTTELFESWRDLYRRRLRWKRGSLGNPRGYGATKSA